MSDHEVRTLKWPFAPLSLLFLPFPLLFAMMAVAELSTGPSAANVAIDVAVTAAFGALWLSATLPLFRSRRLIYSASGLTYVGALRRKHWSWSEFEGASGSMKVVLKVRCGAAGKSRQIFLGPFWRGGSDRIVRLAREHGWAA